MLPFGIHIGGFMGDVIDLVTFKYCRDVQQSTLSPPEEEWAPKALPITLRLLLLAQKAKGITYYTPETGTWNTISAQKICIAIKESFYTLTQPLPDMLRLIVYDGSLLHVDIYFSKKFYASPEYRAMLLALIEEVWNRGCYVDLNFLNSINHKDAEELMRLRSRIDWNSLHKNPFGDDPSPTKQ
jgi:hypothetical protein